jgi:hypothetical protein
MAETKHTYACSNKSSAVHEPFQLLQLPEAALNCVLQKLDPCSLASTAVACSKLRYAVPAAMIKVAVRCAAPDTFENFEFWLEQNSTSLNSATHCSVDGSHPRPTVSFLPCPQL